MIWGEEFAIILDEFPISEAAIKGEKARVAIGQLVIEFEGQPLRVAASAGVATLMEDETVESWLQRTDDALYFSKSEGRNCGHRMQGKKPTLIELSPEQRSMSNAEVLSADDLDSETDLSDGLVLRTIERNGVFASLANRTSLEKSFNDVRSRNQESVSVPPVRVGLAEAAVGEEFERIVSRSLQAAISQSNDEVSPDLSV